MVLDTIFFEMKGGELHGMWKSWDEVGNISDEVSFFEGEKHGTEINWFYEEGLLFEEWHYKHGLLHGLCAGFDKDGNAVWENYYSDGQLVRH